MSYWPLRLQPGDDLRRSLEQAIGVEARASAFVVAGIGSLSDPRLRLAGAEADTVLAGPWEILSLSGSVSPDGAHLHTAIADAQGRVVGGHVAYGNVVRTTAELLLIRLPDGQLAREHDPATGFKELVVRPAGRPGPA